MGFCQHLVIEHHRRDCLGPRAVPRQPPWPQLNTRGDDVRQAREAEAGNVKTARRRSSLCFD